MDFILKGRFSLVDVLLISGGVFFAANKEYLLAFLVIPIGCFVSGALTRYYNQQKGN